MDERTKTFAINTLAETPKRVEESLAKIKLERFFVKELEASIKKSGQRIFLIAGLRGTGKTTALYQVFSRNERENTVYFSCDELLSREIGLEELISAIDIIKKENVGLGKKFTLLLDEITYLENWDLKLKVISDKRPNLIIIATSSSSLQLKKTKELARRAFEIQVLPFSFREYLALKYSIIIPDTLAKSIRKKLGNESLEGEYIQVRTLLGNHNLFGIYEEYLRQDLPSSLILSEQAYHEAVIRIVKRTVYEDFSKYEKFESKLLVAAEILVKYLSTVPADGVKISTLAEVAGISKESVVKILDALEMAMIVRGIEHEGRNRMFKKPKKWFFYSPSMRYVLASPVSSSSDITGNLREDSVFRHLIAASDQLFYSHEADFIASGMKIEVGKSKKPRKGVIRFSMEEGITIDNVPVPLFALSI